MLFARIYDKVMLWSRHKKAPWILGSLSFAESSFFPVPPDVMLAPMCLAQPKKAYWFALLTTLTSVLGGVLGYLIGYLAFEAITPYMQEWGYWEKYLTVKAWFDAYGFWAVFIAGFSPVPYKLFTITAGALAMNPVLFIVASFIGRGGRFFLVSGLLAWGGPKIEPLLKQHIERLGWVVVILGVVAAAYLGMGRS